jgi:hypothetical protein
MSTVVIMMVMVRFSSVFACRECVWAGIQESQLIFNRDKLLSINRSLSCTMNLSHRSHQVFSLIKGSLIKSYPNSSVDTSWFKCLPA